MSYSAQKAGREGEEGPSRGGKSQGHGGGADEEQRGREKTCGEEVERGVRQMLTREREHTFRIIQKTYSM